jgi:hypothetical protein
VFRNLGGRRHFFTIVSVSIGPVVALGLIVWLVTGEPALLIIAITSLVCFVSIALAAALYRAYVGRPR